MPSTRSSKTGSQPDASKLLVTVGSTLFPALTDEIFSTRILDVLVGLGVKTLVVQIGKGNSPKRSDSFEKWSMEGEGGNFRYSPRERSGKSGDGLTVEWTRYTSDFEGMVNEADAVISHAGSGSILTALRAQKPLLVVPNESLMDNHQGQLGEALERDGYLMVSSLEDLPAALVSLLDSSWAQIRTRFPDFDGRRFLGVLDETAGFAQTDM